MKGIEEKQIEAPYELPEGWKWCRLGEVGETLTGSTPSKKKTEYYGGDFPFFKPADLEQGINLFQSSEYLSAEGKKVSRIVPAKSTLICCIGSIGKSGYSLREGTTNQQINAIIPHKYIDSKYLFHAVNTEDFINQLWSKASSTTISIVNKSKMDNCIIPLPPTLAEQQRIVNRIESMFAKLDEAKEKAQNVVDGFETRKAAILHQAFTNKLKIENGKLKDEEWKERKLGEICEVTSSKRVYQTEQTSSGIPFLRIADIMCKIQNKDVFPELFISAERYKKLQSQNLVPKENEILVTSRGTLGKCYLIKKDDMFYFQDGMISWLKNIDRNISSQYLIYLFQSKEITNQIEEMQNGSTVNYLSISMLKKISIPIPPFNFQLSIVNFLDSVLEKERTAKEAAEAVLEQIDLLKKSILARAFRGEL